jgi:hypothetical protein
MVHRAAVVEPMKYCLTFVWSLRILVAAVVLATASIRVAVAQPMPLPRAGSVLQESTPAAAGSFEPEEIAAADEFNFGPPASFEHVTSDCEGGPCEVPCRDDCIEFYDFWARGDYLLWWKKGADLPPLVSTGPLSGTNSILFGGDDVGSDVESGGRVELGVWFDACHERGIGGRFFALGDETTEFNSAGLTNVARPFIDATPGSPALGMENALLVSAPGGPVGNVLVRMTSDVFGGDIYYQRALCRDACSRVDFLVGYQMSQIDENLTIAQQIADGGVTVNGTDVFDTRNEFHGAEVGLLASRCDCRWTLEVLAKVGVGNMDQTVTISGMETRQPPLVTSNGSLLALPTNIGRYNRDEFAAVPELGVNVSYELSNCLDFTFGYSIIYWSDVLRPGDQIDRTINGTQTSGGMLMGAARPQFAFVDGDYWVQGINLGFTLRR